MTEWDKEYLKLCRKILSEGVCYGFGKWVQMM